MEKAFKKRFVILVLPTLIAFTVAFIIPFILGIYLSFTKFTTVADAQWVGLSNYIVAFQDKDFLASLWFTVKFVLVNLVTINLIAFALAYVLSRKLRGTNIFRTVIFMPNLLGGIVLGYIWQLIINGVLAFFKTTLTVKASYGFWGMVIAMNWQMIGYMMVIYIAAIQNFSEDVKEVKEALLQAGMFAFIRQRPYDVIADPTVTPKAIFISAFDSNPLAPDFEFVLKGEEANFQTGLDALARMAKTYLSISVKQKSAALVQAKNVTVTAFDGPNPAGNVGVQINHISPVVKGETVWTIGAEAVIFIGRLMNTGRVNFTRTVAVTGSEVLKPAYCKLQVGALLTDVFKGNVTTDKDLRYISGNVLTGKKIAANGFLGAFDSQLTVIPEGDEIHEMLGWIMPRFNQFSVNRSYFSWLMGKKEYVIDARIKGGERHMIMSGEYDRVFPMDIFPEYLLKAIIAGDIDRMEALGIYEVAPEDFALCEFVCSSKVEIQRIVRAGLDMLRAEMA